MSGKYEKNRVFGICGWQSIIFCLLTLALLLALSFAALADDIPIDQEHFPCDGFRIYVSGSFDTDSDGILSEAEADAVEEISTFDFEPAVISNLQGLEYFQNLKRLDVSAPAWDWFMDFTLDVSGNPKLEELTVLDTDLITLDLSKNTRLKKLHCSGNRLKKLDLRKNKALTEVYCDNNFLKTLLLGKHASLKKLACSINNLSSLDVSECPLLTECVKKGKRTEVIGDLRPSSGEAYDESVWKYKDSYLSVDACIPVKAGSKTAAPLTDGPVPANCYVDQKYGLMYCYSYSDNTAEIVKPSKKTAKKITIPATLDDEYTVTKIEAKAFQGMTSLEEVSLPKTLKSIGKNAFKGCSKLKKIVIKTKLLKSSSVGANAFKGIYSKPTVTCPKGMTKTYKKLLLKKGMPKKATFK